MKNRVAGAGDHLPSPTSSFRSTGSVSCLPSAASSTTWKISFTQVGLIAGMFIAGYGIAHIPAGWFAERYGMRAGMIFGVVVQTLGTAVTAWAPSYETILVGWAGCRHRRPVTMGSSVGWWRPGSAARNWPRQSSRRRLLPRWRPPPARTAGAWSSSRSAGGRARSSPPASGRPRWCSAGLLPRRRRSGQRRRAGRPPPRQEPLRRIFGNRTLWIAGLACSAPYGCYFSAANLLGHYAQERLKLSAFRGRWHRAPSCSFGGRRRRRHRVVDRQRCWAVRPPTFPAFACFAEGIMFFLIPHLNLLGLQIAAAVVGWG